MRKMYYELSNGTKVYTLREAEESGLSYTIGFEPVVEKGSELSPMRKAMLEQFGYVSPELRDKVVGV